MQPHEPHQPEPSHSTQKMGKGMIIIAWLLGLGLLTLFFDDQLAKQFNPNTQPQSQRTKNGAEVLLKQNRMGHYVANGKINGQQVTFLLDTGATDVSIPYALALDLGLQPGRRQYANTANGTIEVAQTRIDWLELGDIRLNNIAASMNPGMGGDKILLGMSALKQLEFSQRDDWLLLRQ